MHGSETSLTIQRRQRDPPHHDFHPVHHEYQPLPHQSLRIVQPPKVDSHPGQLSPPASSLEAERHVVTRKGRSLFDMFQLVLTTVDDQAKQTITSVFMSVKYPDDHVFAGHVMKRRPRNGRETLRVFQRVHFVPPINVLGPANRLDHLPKAH